MRRAGKKAGKLSDFYVRSLIYSILTWIFVVTIVASIVSLAEIPEGENDELYDAPMVGTYNLGDNGEPFSFDDLDEITVGKAQKITLKGHFTRDIPESHYVFVFVYKEHIVAKINGQIVFDNKDDYLTRWDNFENTAISKNDQVEITISALPGDVYAGSITECMKQICVGTRYGLLRDKCNDHVVSMFICIAIFIFAIGDLMVSFVLIITRRSEARGSISCGLVMLFGSFCCFVDYNYITLVLGNYKIIGFLDTVNQLMLLLFFLMNMFIHFRNKKYARVSAGFLISWFGFSVAYIIAHLMQSSVPENNWIVLMSGGSILGIVINALMQSFECYQYKIDSGKLSGEMIANILLAGFTIVEVAYYMMTHTFIISVFQVGIAIYCVMQFVSMINRTIEYSNKIRQADMLEKQIVENQMSIMLSQIQPHFLYNSLTAIQMLCMEDAQMAQKALGDFAQYLRGNMDSLKSNQPIPFTKELEHTKHYVELELIRQGEYLEVEYDIQFTDFEVPALSLQPIVENAIKHGVGNREDGGTVRISVRRKYDNAIIVVEDDGVGFTKDEEKNIDDNRSHVGLENVRRRLSDMCGASIDISSRLSVGTRVTITIPIEEKSI